MSTVLAALKYCEVLRTKPAFRRARRAWVQAFKQLRDQVDAQCRLNASGKTLPSRCNGYVDWQELCRIRDTLPYGSIERLLVELHTHALGRSREYAAVRLFTQVPSRAMRRRYPNHCVLHPRDPASSYLRFGDYKTAAHVGAYKVRLSASLHRAIVTSLQQQPRRHLFEPPSKPGQPFEHANTFNKYVNRKFAAVFGRPLTSNSIRHAFANTVDLSDESQLQHAARRLAHTNIGTLQLQSLYVWGALKRRQLSITDRWQ